MYPGERFNGLTHLSGALLALAGTVVLVVLASLKADPWKIVSFSIYGATLLFLYASSTLYHSTRGRAKSVFRKLDHAAIYLLIAGTYTPFTLVSLQRAVGMVAVRRRVGARHRGHRPGALARQAARASSRSSCTC